ncbi:general substrate transporter [Exidia glandulosa HHB12029]|uniref:General substrate transporter n=1 Tax=Exidia glandulosa HHB12029 TaxID=1314781 RepID=A0A165MKP1_EXIGL|nr:general substrate transporter [Exidia glandulosa HHB12029]
MVATVKDKQNDTENIISRLAAEDAVAWYRKPNLRFLYFMLFPTCMGIELTSGFDSQMINALQIVPSWISYFDNPQGALKGIIAAAYSLGAILSLPLVPIVNDRLGRRWSIFLGSLVMVLGAVVQATAQNEAQYIIARMILGFGIPTCIVSGSSLIGELGYPKERPILTSLFNVSYFIGQILAAGICLRTNQIVSNWAWRLPSALQAIPSLLQIAFVFFLPESPRFLISKGRMQEAEDILYTYHAEGDRSSEFVKAEIAQIRTTIELELEGSKRSWLDLVRTPGKRHRLLVTSALGLFTQWSGNTLISYYLGDILKMIGQTSSLFQQRLNLGLSAWQGVVAFIAAMLVTRFKRRAMYLTCTISLLLCYISWTISAERSVTAKDAGHPNQSANIAVIFFIFAYSPCYNIGYNALTYTYMVELWPYAERSRGIAIFQLFGRLSGFFTTFVNPIGMKNISWKYLITYCVWLAFEIVFVYFFFPETSGRTLEELAFLFEDKALAEKVNAAADHALHDAPMSPATQNEKEILKDDDVVHTEKLPSRV